LELAQRMVRAVAPELGITPRTDLRTSLGELRPYARVSAALGRADPRAAAAALALARPEVARDLWGARDLAEAVLADGSLPPASRLMAARIARHFNGLHSVVAAIDPRDAVARAEHARLLLAEGELDRAAVEIERIGKPVVP